MTDRKNEAGTRGDLRRTADLAALFSGLELTHKTDANANHAGELLLR